MVHEQIKRFVIVKTRNQQFFHAAFRRDMQGLLPGEILDCQQFAKDKG